MTAVPRCRQLLAAQGPAKQQLLLPERCAMQLTGSDNCAGEALPEGMTVYSNAVHGLSASTSGQGSSAAGPLEMSLPRLEQESVNPPPGVQASQLLSPDYLLRPTEHIAVNTPSPPYPCAARLWVAAACVRGTDGAAPLPCATTHGSRAGTGPPQRRMGQGIEIRTPPRAPGLHGQLEHPDEVPCPRHA